MGGTEWSAPEKQRLTEMWMGGSTATEIAFAMGGERSRNSIIGKVHALGLKRDPKPKKKAESGQMRSGVRKAFASKGDDATLTRFVKISTAQKPRKHCRQPRLAGMEAAFVAEGRTKFAKSVKAVKQVSHLLVSGHSNVKIGRDVRKAKLRGYWIYTLSLEERKTCPSSCKHWQSCYGNNMPFAKRIDHTDPDFLRVLEYEIGRLCSVRGRPGVLIRLHALGDFYSTAYVEFWMRMLRLYADLAIYGYTARQPSPNPQMGDYVGIGDLVAEMNRRWPERCFIRFSDGGLPTMSTVSIGDETGCPPNAFLCPEQTGKTRCCATCGACWSTTKNVAFMEH